jgi:mono/diheme cytochrome c family protein
MLRHLQWKKALELGIRVGSVVMVALSAIACFAAEKPQDLYKANCEGCHGPSGRTSDLGKSLGAKSFKDPVVIKTPASALARVIAKGKKEMPPFGGTLTAAEIRELAKYIKEMK